MLLNVLGVVVSEVRGVQHGSRVKPNRRIHSSRISTTMRWRWSRGDSNRGRISSGSWSRIRCHRRGGITRLKNN